MNNTTTVEGRAGCLQRYAARNKPGIFPEASKAFTPRTKGSWMWEGFRINTLCPWQSLLRQCWKAILAQMFVFGICLPDRGSFIWTVCLSSVTFFPPDRMFSLFSSTEKTFNVISGLHLSCICRGFYVKPGNECFMGVNFCSLLDSPVFICNFRCSLNVWQSIKKTLFFWRKASYLVSSHWQSESLSRWLDSRASHFMKQTEFKKSWFPFPLPSKWKSVSLQVESNGVETDLPKSTQKVLPIKMPCA